MSAHRLQCLGIDTSKKVIMHDDCGWQHHSYTWIWESDFLIRMVGTQFCLSLEDSSSSNLAETETAGLVVRRCNRNDVKQKWFCPTINGNKLLLSLEDSDPPILIQPKKDKDDVIAIAGSGFSGASSSWYILGQSDTENICSYLDGAPRESISCTRFGYWTPPPGDINCFIVRCPAPIDIEGTTHQLLSPTTAYGAELVYECGIGKMISQTSLTRKFECIETGAWYPSLDVIECIPVLCPSPPHVSYADLIGFDFSYDHTVKYTCTTGYWMSKLVYSKTTRCTEEAKWDPDPSQIGCIPVDCKHPGEIDNARSESQTPIGYEAIVGYTCYEGYWISRGVFTASITCQNDGSFRPPVSSLACVAVTCIVPSYIPSASQTDRKVLNYQYQIGEEATFECYSGTWISPGKVSVTFLCQNNGEWSPKPSSIACKSIMCGPPEYVQNGIIQSGGNYVGAYRTVRCNEGFWVDQANKVGETSIICSIENARWNPEEVKCKVAICADVIPPIASHHLHIPVSLTFNEVIVFECDKGYRLQNSEDVVTMFSTTCQADGTWTPDPSTFVCEKMKCQFPSISGISAIAEFSVSLDADFVYGEEVTMICSDGYWLSMEGGKKLINFHCDETGNFAPPPEFTYCTVIKCEFPPSLPNSQWTGSSLDFNATIEYNCVTGFASADMTTSWLIRCDESGVWEGLDEQVDCQVISCGHPGEIARGLLVGNQFTYGRSVKYICDLGTWMMSGVFELKIKCMANGRWNEIPTDCTDTGCPDPRSLVANAQFTGTGSTYGRVVTISCNEGYYFRPGK